MLCGYHALQVMGSILHPGGFEKFAGVPGFTQHKLGTKKKVLG